MAEITIQQAFEKALQHHQSRRLPEAEQIYRQILAQQPQHPGATHYLGVLAFQVGRSDAAVDLLQRAIALNPKWPDSHHNLGNALSELGQFDEAIAAYRQAIALNPKMPEAHNNLGVAFKNKGRFDEAIAAYRRAIALRSEYAAAYSNLGDALRETGQLDESIAACRHAIALKPDYAEAHSNLGNALTEKGDLDDAIAAYHKAIGLRPNYANAHANLGRALKDKGQLDEAIAAYRRSVALNPNSPETYNLLGNAWQDKVQLDEAIAAYRQSIAVEFDYADGHHNLAYALLGRGDFEEGWKEHEWRWKCDGFPSPRRNFAQPQWNGGPLEGRTLLLHAEQGLGDAIQFIRYVPLVAERGGKIIMECTRELERLVQNFARGCRIVTRGEPLPAFDLHCPLLSLPLAFRTTLANILAAIPYLHADPKDVQAWRSRLAEYSSSLKVGLSWAGNPIHKNDRIRSMPLTNFSPLAQTPGVRFFSLQKGPASAQAKTPASGLELVDWTDDLKDFADTAALIVNLDLVISVDTAIVHLAGAMGLPVWTLLPFAPDWRWLRERDDSPWYPSMRLFRQASAGDWAGVMSRVAEALAMLQTERV